MCSSLSFQDSLWSEQDNTPVKEQIGLKMKVGIIINFTYVISPIINITFIFVWTA